MIYGGEKSRLEKEAKTIRENFPKSEWTEKQKAAIKALDYNVDDYIEQYKRNRDLIYEGLKEKYRVQKPGGAFYIFPEVPGGDGEAFVEKAIQQNLFIIPGSVFSKRNTHIRISLAAPEERLLKGIEVLNRIG